MVLPYLTQDHHITPQPNIQGLLSTASLLLLVERRNIEERGTLPNMSRVGKNKDSSALPYA